MSYVVRIEQLPELLETIKKFHQTDVAPNAKFTGELCDFSLNVRPLPSEGLANSLKCPHCQKQIHVNLS